MEEIWKDIKGYEGFYQVSNYGNIRSVNHTTIRKNGIPRPHKGVILRPSHYSNGYQFVVLSKGVERKQFSVHRLVLSTFEGEKSGFEVNHIDENKDNNHLDNLEWVTHKYNCQYGTRNVRCKEHSDFSGYKNPMYGKKGVLNPRSKKCYAEKDGKKFTFSCLREMADFLDCSPQYVSDVIRGSKHNDSIKGYKLSFCDSDLSLV